MSRPRNPQGRRRTLGGGASFARPALPLLPALAALVAVFVGGAVACGRGVEVRKAGTRAVVIGIDGADWRVIEALAAEGGMPHLMALRERGAWGPIETLHDVPLSPVIWTTIATGKSAAQHGISWFMVDRPDGTRAPVRSHNRKVKAIWNVLGENGRRPTTIGWWATYPAEDVGKGMVVSDALGFHGFGATARGATDAGKTWPSSLYAEVDPLLPPLQQITADYAARFIHIEPDEYSRLMFTPARQAEPDPLDPLHLFQQYAVTAEGYTAIAERLLERPYDLFMVYFEQVDSFSHLFMKYAPPRLGWVDPDSFERYRDLVSEWYRHQDELLGRLLAKIDLETTAVFIVSDHGFKSGERRIRSEETVDVRRAHLDHEPDGVFLAAGPHIRRGARVTGASVLDVTPTLLWYLGFPVGKDMDGKVLATAFDRDFAEENPIRYIESYEEKGKEKEEKAEGDAYDAGAAEKNLEALRALGYLGGGADGDDGVSEVPEIGDEETSAELLANRGRIQMARGDTAAARKEFERALAVNPGYAEALLGLAEIERFDGRVAQAERLVERALQVDPNSIGALAQLAELKRDQGDLPEAIRLFEEALAIDDSLPFLHLGYGDVLQRSGRFDDAVAAFELVLQLDPDSFKARYNLGVTYGNQGREDLAIAEYEKALALDPKNPEASAAFNNLGAIHQARGEIDRAAERFEQAVESSPFNLEARYNLAVIYLARDRVAEAVDLLERAARLEPNHELVNVRLGWAYLRLARNDDAYKSLLLVRRLYPGNWEASLGLALLYASAGELDRARQLLDDAYRSGGAAARRRAADFPLLEKLG